MMECRKCTHWKQDEAFRGFGTCEVIGFHVKSVEEDGMVEMLENKVMQTDANFHCMRFKEKV